MAILVAVYGCSDPHQPNVDSVWGRIDSLTPQMVLIGDTVTLHGQFEDYGADRYRVQFKDINSRVVRASTSKISFVAPRVVGLGRPKLYRILEKPSVLDHQFIESPNDLVVADSAGSSQFDTIEIKEVFAKNDRWSYSSPLYIQTRYWMPPREIEIEIDGVKIPSDPSDSIVRVDGYLISLHRVALPESSVPRTIRILNTSDSSTSHLPAQSYSLDSLTVGSGYLTGNVVVPGDRVRASVYYPGLVMEFNGALYDPVFDPAMSIDDRVLVIKSIPEFDPPGAMLRFLERHTGYPVAQGWVERGYDTVVVETDMTWNPERAYPGESIEVRYDPSLDRVWNERIELGGTYGIIKDRSSGYVRATVVCGSTTSAPVSLVSIDDLERRRTYLRSKREYQPHEKPLPLVPYGKAEIVLTLPCWYRTSSQNEIRGVREIATTLSYGSRWPWCDTLLSPEYLPYVYDVVEETMQSRKRKRSNSGIAIDASGRVFRRLSVSAGSSSESWGHNGAGRGGSSTEYTLSGLDLPIVIDGNLATIEAQGSQVFSGLQFEHHGGSFDNQQTSQQTSVVRLDPENAHLTRLSIRLSD